MEKEMPYIEEGEFVINDDLTADKLIEKIAESEAVRDRLVELADQRIEEIQQERQAIIDGCAKETDFYKMSLSAYFENFVPAEAKKETKTQTSYKLLSGTLVQKKATQKINHDDEKLIDELKATFPEYIKTKESVDWANLKKILTIKDGAVIEESSGAVIESCSIEDVPATFSVKF